LILIDRDVPDTEFAGYPACRISGRSKSRISGLLKKMNCSVSNKSLRYWFLEDTCTVIEEVKKDKEKKDKEKRTMRRGQ